MHGNSNMKLKHKIIDVSFEYLRTIARKLSLAHFIYSETGL
jgi:hypothetical protein